MTETFMNLLILLGCAVIFGLICIVLALTWWIVKLIAASAKEAFKGCSPAKTAQTEKSDATLAVKNTDEKK